MEDSVSIRLKSQLVLPTLKKGSEERVFWTVATSQVVDTQKEIIDMKYITELLPILKARGVSVNLGHFGVNVGRTEEAHLKTLGEVMKAFPDNQDAQKILAQYNPKTPALVMKGRISHGNKYDDLAWEMIQKGDVNGTSVGLDLVKTNETQCDTNGCGIVMKGSSIFELALTGKGLDFPIKSFSPANPTSLILATKAHEEEICLKCGKPTLKSAEHAPKGGITLNGKDYVGGQFIPKEDLEDMSSEDREKLEDAQKEKAPETESQRQILDGEKPKEKDTPKKYKKGDPPFTRPNTIGSGTYVVGGKNVKGNTISGANMYGSYTYEEESYIDNKLDEMDFEGHEERLGDYFEAKDNKGVAENKRKENIKKWEESSGFKHQASQIPEMEEALQKHNKTTDGKKYDPDDSDDVKAFRDIYKAEKKKSIDAFHESKEYKVYGDAIKKFSELDENEETAKSVKLYKQAFKEEFKKYAEERDAYHEVKDKEKIKAVSTAGKAGSKIHEATKSPPKTKEDMNEVEQAFETIAKHFEDSPDMKAHMDQMEEAIAHMAKTGQIKNIKTLQSNLKASGDRLKSQKLLASAGNDLRRFIASKMGLPDTQLEKVAEAWTPNTLKKAQAQMDAEKKKLSGSEKELKDLDKQSESRKKKKEKEAEADKKKGDKKKSTIAKTRERASQLRAKKKESKERNIKLDAQLSDKIQNMSSSEVDRLVNTLFKAHLKRQKEMNGTMSKMKNTKPNGLAFKGHYNNTDGAMQEQESQDGYPPHEGEFSLAQVMKMMASMMERVGALENMQRQPEMVQPEAQAPMEQPAQLPQEGEAETPFGGEEEGSPEEGGNPFAEEGEEGEEESGDNPFAESSDEEGESDGEESEESEEGGDNPFSDGGDSDEEESEETSDEEGDSEEEEEEVVDEEDSDQKSDSSLDDKVDNLTAKMNELVGSDDDEDVVMKGSDEEEEEETPDEGGYDEDDVSMKKVGTHHYHDKEGEHEASMIEGTDLKCLKCGKMKTETEAVSTKADEVEAKSTKSADVGNCECGNHSKPTDSKKESKPSMKTEENLLTKEVVADLLKEALATQKTEIYEQLGVKTTETPITTVDGQNQVVSNQDDDGVSLADVAKHFGKLSGTPSMGELAGFVSTKGGI